MSDYQFKVGDKGKTRSASSELHAALDALLEAKRAEAGRTMHSNFYPDGKYVVGISANDLMPPEQRSASSELHAALDALLEAERAEAAAEKVRREATTRRMAAQSKFYAELGKAAVAK